MINRLLQACSSTHPAPAHMQRRALRRYCHTGDINARQPRCLAVSTSSCHNSEQKVGSFNLAMRTTYHFWNVTSGAYFGKNRKNLQCSSSKYTHFSVAARLS